MICNEINITQRKKNDLFQNNINLLFDFPNNQILYLKYKNLSEELNKNNWKLFFNIYKIKGNIKKNQYIEELNKIMKRTSDKNLNKLIKMHINL